MEAAQKAFLEMIEDVQERLSVGVSPLPTNHQVHGHTCKFGYQFPSKPIEQENPHIEAMRRSARVILENGLHPRGQ